MKHVKNISKQNVTADKISSDIKKRESSTGSDKVEES